jgi:SAM-dependent methyltransferase
MSVSPTIDMRAAWNHISPGYQAEHQISVDAAHYGPFLPSETELRLLGDVAGLRILELGCGGGQCSIAFARQGALVAGIDLSDEQIGFALRLAAEHGVTVDFRQGDASDLSCFAAASFDVVFSAYALHYVPAIELCLAEAARVLIPGGRLVFSLDHPFREVFWDEEADEDSLVAARSYWRRSSMEWQWSGGGTWMRSFHRTMGDWVDLLHGAGLQVQRILEPEPQLDKGETISWSGSYDLEMVRLIPQTVIFVASKGGGREA